MYGSTYIDLSWLKTMIVLFLCYYCINWLLIDGCHFTGIFFYQHFVFGAFFSRDTFRPSITSKFYELYSGKRGRCQCHCRITERYAHRERSVSMVLPQPRRNVLLLARRHRTLIIARCYNCGVGPFLFYSCFVVILFIYFLFFLCCPVKLFGFGN